MKASVAEGSFDAAESKIRYKTQNDWFQGKLNFVSQESQETSRFERNIKNVACSWMFSRIQFVS